MADIVKNERDSALLYTKGVILNKMRSDKAVAELFSSLSKEVTLDPESSFFVEFYVKVHAYCQKPIPLRKLRVNFIDTYCMSPWATVSLIAAILLFTLSIIQTIFTVLQYYKG